MCKVE